VSVIVRCVGTCIAADYPPRFTAGYTGMYLMDCLAQVLLLHHTPYTMHHTLCTMYHALCSCTVLMHYTHALDGRQIELAKMIGRTDATAVLQVQYTTHHSPCITLWQCCRYSTLHTTHYASRYVLQVQYITHHTLYTTHYASRYRCAAGTVHYIPHTMHYAIAVLQVQYTTHHTPYITL
jgi:hypothetical protein